MNARRQVLTAAALALLMSQAHAESLQDAWQRALVHDAAFAAMTAERESADANERAARGARWPSLTASAGYTRFDHAPEFDIAASGMSLRAPIFADDEVQSHSVELKLPLFTAGRITAEIGAAHEAAQAASAMERAASAGLRLQVAREYVDVLRAQRQHQSALLAVESLRAHASDVGHMVERDMVARSDLLAAQVALANAEQNRVRAENGVALAYAAYNRRLGEPLDRRVELEQTIALAPEATDESLEVLLTRALQNRQEMNAATARAGALALQADAARAALLPQLALTGGYNYFANEVLDRENYSSVGIGLYWNVFDGGVMRNRSASLQHASRAARLRADDLRTLIELEVRQAWLEVREARARAASSREAVDQADENLRITRELYGAGLGTNTQVLDAVALRVSAINNRDNATLDEALAQLTLARAVGAL